MVTVAAAISLGNVRLRTLAVLLLTGLAPADAQPVAPAGGAGPLEGRIISRIDYEPAEQPLPREELDRVLPFKPGQPLRRASIPDAIQKLYSTGRFADVAMDGEPDGAGVRLRITTETAYFVGQVSVRGEREPPNRNQLVTASQLELGTPFHEDEIPAAIARMQERLRANGLYQAKVQYRVERNASTGDARVFFDVDAGERARFGGVQFAGEFDEPAEDLIRASGWRRAIAFVPLPGWNEMNDNRMQSGAENIRRRMQRNDRLQASVTLEAPVYDPLANRVTPRLTIRGGPAIQVRVIGADVSDKDLRDLIPIFQERAVDNLLLEEGRVNLANYLQSRGYFDATVDQPRLEPGAERTVIEYTAHPGERHKLTSIQFTGNTYFLSETLRERMYIQPATLLRYRRGRYSPRRLVQDVGVIEGLYRANGFLNVKVTAETPEDPLDHTNISVRIHVMEGAQAQVSGLQIEGAAADDEEYLRTLLRSAAGQPFSAVNVAADRDAILTYYYNNGYPSAAFDWTQENGPTPDTVQLRYTVEPGERRYVRDVLVSGRENTSRSLVADQIGPRPGDTFSQSEIALSQQKLYDLGIFSKVQTAVQNPEGSEERKYIVFQADEARKYSFNFGVGAEFGRIGGGVSSLNAPAGATGFAPRLSVGLSRINFLGLAHTVSLQTLYSTQQRRALLNYLAPQIKGHENLALNFSALFNDSRDVRTFSALRGEGSVQLSQRLSTSDTAQYRYTYRRVTLDRLNIAKELIPLLSQAVRVGLVGGTFFRDRRDDPVDSRRGAYNSFDFAVAAAPFGSQASFTRLVLRNSTYYPLKRDLVLARSLQFGYIERTGGLAEIPLAERFYAGGASTHRGFPSNQAGPRDLETGFPLGGNVLLVHSTELRFPLIGDNLGGVLFHDMGNVFSNISNVTLRARQRNLQDFDYMVHSVGFGIRYRTPVGPIRVDLGYGPNTPRFRGVMATLSELLNAPRDRPLCVSVQCVDQRISRFQFHFSLGQTF